MIFYSLAPKTYFAYDKDKELTKRSSKGIQHKVHLDYEDYKAALYENKTFNVKNTIIRSRNGSMCTLISEKVGLKNVLSKAFVMTDRVTVKPFSKVL